MSWNEAEKACAEQISYLSSLDSINAYIYRHTAIEPYFGDMLVEGEKCS